MLSDSILAEAAADARQQPIAERGRPLVQGAIATALAALGQFDDFKSFWPWSLAWPLPVRAPQDIDGHHYRWLLVRSVSLLVLELESAASIEVAVAAVAEERRRQIEKAGWTTVHDDEKETGGSLVRGGAGYAAAAIEDNEYAVRIWPWSPAWAVPVRDDSLAGSRDYSSLLTRAAALFVAEIERGDRAVLKAAA